MSITRLRLQVGMAGGEGRRWGREEMMTGRRKKGTGGCRLEGMCWIPSLREAVIFAQLRLSPEARPAPVLEPHGLFLSICISIKIMWIRHGKFWADCVPSCAVKHLCFGSERDLFGEGAALFSLADSTCHPRPMDS